MESYRNSFRNKNDLMVVQPNSEFFRYMKSSKGGGK
jgi:membrane protease subunit HflC